MAQNQQAGSRGARRRGSPGALSRWWQQRITAAQPRYAKYQRNTDREYPVIRLTPR
jgi:hypothetical protein